MKGFNLFAASSISRLNFWGKLITRQFPCDLQIEGTNLAKDIPKKLYLLITMNFKRNICGLFCAVGSCAIFFGTSSLSAESSVLGIPVEQIDAQLRETPMPELGEGRLAKILERYYLDGLGGIENWSKVSSLKVSGQLKLKGGDFELLALQKKPNLIKMTISGPQSKLSLGYDGKIAWQKLPGREAKAEPMPESEARRFIHSSHFGNHLLFPFAEGKEITYVDTVPTDGDICHHLRVVLDTGYQVDYYLDIRSYLEQKVVNTDLKSNFVNTIIYRDYSRASGMPIARTVESFENGNWVSTLTLDEVKANAGIVPWMFRMPR
jgi:hypothetical protein